MSASKFHEGQEVYIYYLLMRQWLPGTVVRVAKDTREECYEIIVPNSYFSESPVTTSTHWLRTLEEHALRALAV